MNIHGCGVLSLAGFPPHSGCISLQIDNGTLMVHPIYLRAASYPYLPWRPAIVLYCATSRLPVKNKIFVLNLGERNRSCKCIGAGRSAGRRRSLTKRAVIKAPQTRVIYHSIREYALWGPANDQDHYIQFKSHLVFATRFPTLLFKAQRNQKKDGSKNNAFQWTYFIQEKSGEKWLEAIWMINDTILFIYHLFS